MKIETPKKVQFLEVPQNIDSLERKSPRGKVSKFLRKFISLDEPSRLPNPEQSAIEHTARTDQPKSVLKHATVIEPTDVKVGADYLHKRSSIGANVCTPVETQANTLVEIKRNIRKLSQGVLNFGKNLKTDDADCKALIKNNERSDVIPRNQNPPEIKKNFRKFSLGNLGRSAKSLDATAEDFRDFGEKRRKSAGVLQATQLSATPSDAYSRAAPKSLVTRNITDCFRDKKKTKFSPPPELPSPNRDKKASRDRPSSPSVDNKRIDLGDNMPVGRNAGRQFSSLLGGGLKLKERLIVGACLVVVLFTVLLVLDLQMDFGLSGQHVVPSHGRVRYDTGEDGSGATYNSFKKRFLQKTHR